MIIKLLKFVIFAICTLKWYACIYFKKKLYKVHIMHIAAHAYSLYCLSFSHAKTVNRSGGKDGGKYICFVHIINVSEKIEFIIDGSKFKSAFQFKKFLTTK